MATILSLDGRDEVQCTCRDDGVVRSCWLTCQIRTDSKNSVWYDFADLARVEK